MVKERVEEIDKEKLLKERHFNVRRKKKKDTRLGKKCKINEKIRNEWNDR